MTAAVIIARGGSKRLPRKNVRPFCGLPLLAWTVIAAKCSRLVDWVFLSTDDDEMAEIGDQYGAEIIRRPDWPDADKVAANRVFDHAIDVIAERYGKGWMKRFICALPTSPLRWPDDIDRVVEHSDLTDTFIISHGYRPRELCLYKDIAGMVAKMVIIDKEQKYLELNGGLGTMSRPGWYKWMQTKMMAAYGDYDEALNEAFKTPFDYPCAESAYIECEQWQCVEVDTLPEFELAEVLMEHYLLKGRGPEIYYEYARREHGKS